MSMRRPWRIPPAQLEADGVVPALEIPNVPPREFLDARASLRLLELLSARRPAALAPTREWARLLAAVGANPIGATAPYDAPDAGFEAEPIVQNVVLAAHSDADRWAHGPGADTNRRERLFAETVKALTRLRVPVALADETELKEALNRLEPRLIVIGPWRSLREETAHILEAVRPRRRVAFIEPAPYLADGAPSPRLGRLLAKMRRRIIDIEDSRGFNKLQTRLRQVRLKPPAGAFRRSDGREPMRLWDAFRAGARVRSGWFFFMKSRCR